MRKPGSVDSLEDLGRVRLSENFFMREFLYSEIANFYALQNIPDDPDLAIEAGTRLCEELLEPMHRTFGRVVVRSGFRSCEINRLGNEKGHGCARNELNYAAHIWDRRDEAGNMGATACVVIPWFLDRHKAGADWRELAWWIHDHLPYHELMFFSRLTAFNIRWRENPERIIKSRTDPKGTLTEPGRENFDGSHADWYAGFPVFDPLEQTA